MPKIHKVVQGSLEWMELRAGKVTASEMHELITPKWKLKTGGGPHSYLCRKLAEAWRGEPLMDGGSWATDQGSLRETDAIPWYELEYGCDVRRAGFVETDDGRAGCSPDGLIGEDGGLECKCPQPPAMVRYLLAGVVPPEHAVQVQSSLYFSQRLWWDYLCYHPDFPQLVVRMERDILAQSIIAAALGKFFKAFDTGMTRLRKLYGLAPLEKVYPKVQ